jgi:hypothetical protein
LTIVFDGVFKPAEKRRSCWRVGAIGNRKRPASASQILERPRVLDQLK